MQQFLQSLCLHGISRGNRGLYSQLEHSRIENVLFSSLVQCAVLDDPDIWRCPFWKTLPPLWLASCFEYVHVDCWVGTAS